MMLTINNRTKYRARVEGVYAWRLYWSDAKQRHATRFVDPAVAEDVCKVDEALARIRQGVLSKYAECRGEGVDSDWLKDVVHEILHPSRNPKEKPRMLLETMKEFVAHINTYTHNGKPISLHRTYHYKQTLTHLQNYLQATKQKDIEIRTLGKDFYDSFVNYLYREGLKPNTVGERVKNLKVVINALPLQDRAGCEFVERGRCAKISEPVDNVYLTEEELGKLAACELGEKLGRVRDAFLLLAWTGCRYSDLGKLTRDNIITVGNGYQCFKIEQQKTRGRVIIPILPGAAAVLEKYDYQPPKPITNQKFNEYIKQVCQAAGIDDDVTLVESEMKRARGSIQLKRVAHRYKKWECVTAHTARRSFATNMYKRDFPTLMIMSITGHKTERAFLTYIKVSEEENAERMIARFLEQG